MGDKDTRQRAWVAYARKKDIRFYPLWVVVGAIARLFYRLRHWDWSDHTPPPARSLAEVATEFGDPAFGLVGDFMGLLPGGRSHGGSNGMGLSEIGLNYQRDWLADEEAKPGVRIETKKAQALDDPSLWIALHVRMAAFGATWEFNSQHFRQESMARDMNPMNFMDGFPSKVLPDIPTRILGFPPQTTVWRWDVPQPVHVALLRNDNVQLTLSTFGLTTPEFTELTSHIGPLDSIQIQRHQADADARVKDYERRLLRDNGS